jgi:hypothetical protein
MHPKPDDPTEFLARIPDPPARRRGALRWLAAGLVVVVLAAGAGVAVAWRRSGTEPVPRETVAVATASLERRDLSTTKTLSGTIGYGEARPLAGRQDATVTWLPKVGATIKRGGQVFRADDRPVVLFYGGLPMYRDLAGANLVGRDVRIVADNLTALGYPVGRQPWSVADAGGSARRLRADEAALTPALIKAIKQWQSDLGVPATGVIEVGQVEVRSGAIRVASVAVQPGSPANAELMAVTPVRKVITVGAEPADAASIRRGDRVEVELPDTEVAKARVLAVGRDLTAVDGDVGTGPQLLTVTVVVDDPERLAGIDSGEVQVHFSGRTVPAALVAPIEALVALSEGGYAVQTSGGLVAVTTGMFAGGWVEITGDGLTEGTEVTVTS